MAGAAGAAEKSAVTAELQEFRGQYDLADGRLLVVTLRHNTLFVRLNNGKDAELVPVGAGVFTTRRGGLTVEFDQRDNGNVTGVHLRGPVQLVARLE